MCCMCRKRRNPAGGPTVTDTTRPRTPRGPRRQTTTGGVLELVTTSPRSTRRHARPIRSAIAPGRIPNSLTHATLRDPDHPSLCPPVCPRVFPGVLHSIYSRVFPGVYPGLCPDWAAGVMASFRHPCAPALRWPKRMWRAMPARHPRWPGARSTPCLCYL